MRSPCADITISSKNEQARERAKSTDLASSEDANRSHGAEEE